MNKKITATVTAWIFFLCTLPFAVSASDYEGHWAQESIQTLIEADVLNGDENGDIHPDASILRCEFVKITNRLFGFDQPTAENYPDIEKGSWYENEFSAAKNAGYLSGDASGNANPEGQLTRAEISVILYRILKPSQTSDSPLFFTDQSDIPDWAEEAVSVLSQKKIICGYADGSFLPNQFVTRAEAFTLSQKAIALYNISSSPAVTPTPTPTSSNMGNTAGMGGVSVSTGGSSSGSSGGSSKPQNKQLSSPNILKLGDDYIVHWSKVKNADSYDLVFRCGDTEKTISTQELSSDLNEILKEICENTTEESLTFSVKVKANASSGYTDSDYSALSSLDLNVNGFLNTADLQLKASYDYNEMKFLLNWEGGAAKHLTILTEGNKWSLTEAESPFDVTAYVQQGEEAEDYVYTVILENALGRQTTIFDKTMSYFAGGNGSAEDPYQVATAQHFDNIKKHMDYHYIQIADFSLPEDYMPLSEATGVPFSGSYRNGSGSERAEITLHLKNGTQYASLFGRINGAKGEGIKIAGSIESTGTHTAGIAGLAISSDIINCENEADITVTGDSIQNGAYAGGIAGSFEGAGTMENCINTGKIQSSAGMIGGICGQTKAPLTACENRGTVWTTNDNHMAANCFAGGICGNNSAVLTGCVNTGKIQSDFSSTCNQGMILYLGGITGYASGGLDGCSASETAEVNATVITGTPTNSIAGQIGGLIGQLSKNTEVSNLTVRGSIQTAYNSKYFIGGITGTAYASSVISRSANLASQVSPAQYGGIAGRLTGGKITECYNTSGTDGTYLIGGIVCRADSGAIENTFNTGAFPGKNSAGFIANPSGKVTVTNCYNASSTGTKFAVAAMNPANITASNVYYIKTAEETNAVANVTETTAELLTQAFLDLESSLPEEQKVWTVQEDGGYPFPQLIHNPYQGE